MKKSKIIAVAALACCLCAAPERIKAQLSEHQYDQLMKNIDDVLWYEKVGDVAYIDKVFLPGQPRWKESNPTSMSAGNEIKFYAYIFIPKIVKEGKKYPLIVFPHGGVHGNMDTYYAHIIRELIAQEYIIIAADYRGSTGYGENFYNNIDYGGLENEDIFISRNYMVDNFDIVDANRVGIMGWSHGGMITLMNLFSHPGKYKCGFAGVPVSDLIMRMGYADDEYRKLFSEENHIGKTAKDDIAEYKRRSPVWNAEKLEDPLLIHTNTSDDDVNVVEVKSMIRALKAENKKFEYKIFEHAPGGHSFDRLDTYEASKIRLDIYKFLERYLKPGKPFHSVKELRKAAYKF